MAGLPTTASAIARSTWYDFHILWDMGAEPEGHPADRLEVRLAYHRVVMLQYTASYAARLVEAMGVTSSTRLLVIGGGFGFLVETLIAQPYGLASDRTATLDTSTYITGSHTETEEADINALIVGVGVDLGGLYGKALKGQMYDGGARCRVRFTSSALENQSAANSVKGMFPSSTIDVVITDDGYLNYHSDAEIAEIFPAIDRLGAAQVWHIVYPDWGNFRTLSAWKAMRPAHQFIDYWTGQTA